VRGQSADASRTLRSSLAGSFTDGDGVHADGFAERVAAWVGQGPSSAAAGVGGPWGGNGARADADGERARRPAGIAVLGREEGETESSERCGPLPGVRRCVRAHPGHRCVALLRASADMVVKMARARQAGAPGAGPAAGGARAGGRRGGRGRRRRRGPRLSAAHAAPAGRGARLAA